MPRIEMQDLIQGYNQMTADSVILIKQFYSQFDNNVAGAGNRHIINVEPIYLNGIMGIGHAPVELLAYAATKMYICLSTTFFGNAAAIAAVPNIGIYDENNVLMHYANNIVMGWDTTAVAYKYYGNIMTLKNIVFSSLEIQFYLSVSFKGFRITLD